MIPIVRVTLTEDRAHVRRAGTLTLAEGRNEIVIDGISPVLADKTLRASVRDAEVAEAKVERWRATITSELPPRARELEQLLIEQRAKVADHRAQIAVLKTRRALYESLATNIHAEIPWDVLYGTFDRARAAADLERLDALEAQSAREQALLERALAELTATEQRIHALRATQTQTEREGARLRLVVYAHKAGELPAELEYLVPGACWRPYHVASMRGGKLSWTSEACVWQATGEVWSEVELVFSTERPSLGKSPPRLSDDPLASVKKQPVVAVEMREQVIQDTGPGSAPGRPKIMGIDDGGQVRVLRAMRRATVPSDGRPHRFPLFTFESSCDQKLVVMAELAPAALLESLQTNESSHPLLAGPVDLVRDSGFVGRTKIMYVPPGSRFELGWGPDPDLRVMRSEERGKDETSMLSSWITRAHRVDIKVSNLGDRARTLEVTERVPVSELEKVQIAVSAEDTSDGAQPDEDGFVHWALTLPPYGRDVVRLRYTVKRTSDVTGI